MVMPDIKSVTEDPTGTTQKPDGQKSPSGNGETPVTASKVSSPEQAKTYSTEEVEAIAHAIRSDAGRERVAIEKERDSLKAEVAKITADLEDNATEIEKLQGNLDNMSSDDPEKFDLAKELKAAREERKQLRADKASLETEKRSHADELKLASDTLREIAIFDIATEYQNANPEKLKTLCETFNASSQEQIRKVADTLWLKKGIVPSGQKIPLKLDTGRGSGGPTDKQILDDFIKDPYNPIFKQRYMELEGRRNK